MREFFEMSTRAQSVVVIGSLKIAERAGTCRYTDDNAKMLVMLLYLSNVRTARANEPASLVITEGIRTMDRGGLCN